MTIRGDILRVSHEALTALDQWENRAHAAEIAAERAEVERDSLRESLDAANHFRAEAESERDVLRADLQLALVFLAMRSNELEDKLEAARYDRDCLRDNAESQAAELVNLYRLIPGSRTALLAIAIQLDPEAMERP